MGLVHTPRTLFFIGKGLARRQRGIDPDGLGAQNAFVTHCRAGLFDVDYLMHLNNAAYLNYAEYARWELCARNGILKSMLNDKINFLVGGNTVRYRREVRPLWRKFEIHSHLAHLDERHLWIYHAFRYPADGKDPGRIRAQVLCQGLAIQNGQVLDPRKYLVDKVGMDADRVQAVSSSGSGHTNDIMEELMEKFMAMEAVLKQAATKDDELLKLKSTKK